MLWGPRAGSPYRAGVGRGSIRKAFTELEAAEQADRRQRHSAGEHEEEARESVACSDWGSGCMQSVLGAEVQEASVCTPCLCHGQAWPCTVELTPFLVVLMALGLSALF